MPAITVTIPEDKVRAMLSEEIGNIARLAATLEFNIEHDQFDLMAAHLGSVCRSATIAEELRRALDQKHARKA